MEPNFNVIKVGLTAIFGLLSSMLGILYVPVLLMVSCNLIDYATGLMAAKYRPDGTISSYRSIKGIKKKVSMWLLVVVGAIIDQLLIYAAEMANMKSPVTFLVACVVAIWIICNEIISILENIQDTGVELPAFLIPLVKNIKKQAEGKFNNVDQEGDETGDEN